MTVCFFGHKDTPESIRPALEQEIERMVENGGDYFLVGHQGAFDAMVLGCLRKIAGIYPQIAYQVVLAYMPEPGAPAFLSGETILPEGMEIVHPRYAIDHRNRWMAKQSDAAVVYVAHSWGGAAKYAAQMEKKGKPVVNLFDL